MIEHIYEFDQKRLTRLSKAEIPDNWFTSRISPLICRECKEYIELGELVLIRPPNGRRHTITRHAKCFKRN